MGDKIIMSEAVTMYDRPIGPELPPMTPADQDVLGAVVRAHLAMDCGRPDIAVAFVAEARMFGNLHEGKLTSPAQLALDNLLASDLGAHERPKISDDLR